MKTHFKKYVLRMTVGFFAYALGLCALNHFDSDKLPHRYWLILLPVLPIIYIAATTIRFVSEGLDELQRKVVTEAAAFSGIATGFTCFSYLFLRDMHAPEFHAEWAFYIMWAYYGIGAIFSWRRYK
ncbi:MAG: hypothetical protein ABSD77_00350 [Verrucomicrobiota bacterium]|jgi:hypothetical protein